MRRSDGRTETHPLKEWLRRHPEDLPSGSNADTDTSHQLRQALKHAGWKLIIGTHEVRLIKPGGGEDTQIVAELDDDETEIDLEATPAMIEDAEEITFGLERDLQMALRINIEQLEPGLKIIDGGKEQVTEAGRIDITACDASGTIVVIELKAGTAKPEIVAQVLAYMGTVAESDKKPVRGILVARDFHPRVLLAARAISNLKLKTYSFRFTFETV